MKRAPIRRKTPLKRRDRNSVPPEIRRAVFQRDGYCKAQDVWEHECWGGHQAHHILPRSRGGKHTLDNLVRLCARAHIHKVHAEQSWARSVGLLR